MIIITHLLFGALIGKFVSSPVLAIILAFFSHYFLDMLPHTEYSIKNIEKKQWKKSAGDFIKLFLDFDLGLLAIFLFTNASPGRLQIILLAAFSAILPDILSVLGGFWKTKILDKYIKLHQNTIHFLKHKKISLFWRLLTQATVVAFCIFFLIR